MLKLKFFRKVRETKKIFEKKIRVVGIKGGNVTKNQKKYCRGKKS